MLQPAAGAQQLLQTDGLLAAGAAAAGLERDVHSQVRDSGALLRGPHAGEPASRLMSEDEVDQDESGDEAEAGDGNEHETGSSGKPARGVKRKKGGRRNAQVGGAACRLRGACGAQALGCKCSSLWAACLHRAAPLATRGH